jgi:hypothetical protein
MTDLRQEPIATGRGRRVSRENHSGRFDWKHAIRQS